jgi:8-oxo-dGTP diphosphatase
MTDSTSDLTSDQTLRVAAYGICVRDAALLLARWVAQDGTDRHWTLPGGQVDHGEDPYDTVVREVAEETGYDVEVDRLLGIDSRSPRPSHHNIGIFYRVRIVGGDLRNETDGSTDLAEWVSWDDVDLRARSSLVDIGRNLARSEPLTGHVEPIVVEGLLRQ